jgi:hypothetical protein
MVRRGYVKLTHSRRFVTASLAVVTFVVALGLGIAMRSSAPGRADELPGTVLQSASAKSGGVEIFLRRATFSGTAVDAWLDVVPDSSLGTPAGIDPSDATLGNASASSAIVSDSGSVLLRFVRARESGSQSSNLTISAVSILSGPGNFQSVTGTWQLTLLLPPDSEWPAINRLESLRPQAVSVEGRDVLVEAFRTSSETILRYQLGTGLVQIAAPVLVAKDGTSFFPLRSETQGTENLAWFEATPFGSPFVVQFKSLLVNRSSGGIILDLRLSGLGVKQIDNAEVGIEQTPVNWDHAGDAAAQVVSVVMHKDPDRTSIRVVIEGTWNPLLGGKPRMLADSRELFVGGVGNYFTSTGPQTALQATLPGGSLPERLVIVFGDSAREVSAQVTLVP